MDFISLSRTRLCDAVSKIALSALRLERIRCNPLYSSVAMRKNTRFLVVLGVLLLGAILASAPYFALNMIRFYFTAVVLFSALYCLLVLCCYENNERKRGNCPMKMMNPQLSDHRNDGHLVLGAILILPEV